MAILEGVVRNVLSPNQRLCDALEVNVRGMAHMRSVSATCHAFGRFHTRPLLQSRLVTNYDTRRTGERTFHILYQMVAGASTEQADSLQLIQGSRDAVAGKAEGVIMHAEHDKVEFAETMAAMRDLAIGEKVGSLA